LAILSPAAPPPSISAGDSGALSPGFDKNAGAAAGENRLNAQSQIIAVWCGPAFMLVLMIGFAIVSGLFPPHSPSQSAAQVAAWYQTDPVKIRLGLLIFLWGTALYMPFAGVLTVQMRRIEGKFPVWTYVQLMASAGNVITLTFPMAFWATAAFRPDRDPALIQLLNDLGWIPFVGMTSPFLVIPICIAVIGFADKSEHPVFPRWPQFAPSALILHINTVQIGVWDRFG
jgi:hypothetical protein